MSIYGLSTEFTESIRFVTTVHSIDLFSERNGLKCWLVVLRLNVPVNNFSVMSGRSHRFLGN